MTVAKQFDGVEYRGAVDSGEAPEKDHTTTLHTQTGTRKNSVKARGFYGQ